MDIQELGRGMMVPIGTRMEVLLGSEVGPILPAGDIIMGFSGGLDNESVMDNESVVGGV
jgi:predicted amidohydrolase